MKKQFIFLLFTTLSLSFLSCEKEDEYEKLNNQVNEVTFKLYSNTEGALISTLKMNGEPITIKDFWEESCETNHWSTGFTARCEDPTVLMTGEVYVNGKLASKDSANSYLSVGAKIKGD